jgi:hypothetical protein
MGASATVGVLGLEDIRQEDIGQATGFLAALPSAGEIDRKEASRDDSTSDPHGHVHVSTLSKSHDKGKDI